MAIILDKPGFGAQLGTALGGGLSKAFESLASQKIDQMQRRSQQDRQARGLRAIFPEQKAEQLAEFDPLVLREVLKQQLPQMQEAKLTSLVENIIGGVDGEATAQMAPSREDVSVTSRPGEVVERAEEIFKPTAPGAIAAQEIDRLEQALKRPDMPEGQKSRLRAKIEERQDRFDKKQEAIDKKTSSFADKINTDFEAAQSGNQRLGRMRELINSGQLTNPMWASLLDTAENFIPALGVGLNLKGTLSPESQEFEKLSKDFLKDVKKIFGARVTQQEVQQFLKTIPTLSQSDEGKMRVLHNMQLFNEASSAKKKAFDDILKENKGFRPANIEQLVQNRAKKDLDQIANKFKAGFEEREIEKGPETRSPEELEALRRRNEEQITKWQQQQQSQQAGFNPLRGLLEVLRGF